MIRDLTAVPAMSAFPWEETYVGLAKAHKSVTTFYGDVHSREFRHTDDGWQDKNSWRWYNALKHGVNVEGFNVNVTMFTGPLWWARPHIQGIWRDTGNAPLFSAVESWWRDHEIFRHTGRIVFFLQLAGQSSPVHTDFDPAEVPVHLRAPTDFIWITPPDNPKNLTVGGIDAPWACWFNHFVPHGSRAADRPQWSLRIDGVFTEKFRSAYIA